MNPILRSARLSKELLALGLVLSAATIIYLFLLKHDVIYVSTTSNGGLLAGVLSVFATLGGAYAGARFAFNLENKRAAREQRHKEMVEILSVFSSLMQMTEVLTGYQHQFIAPLRSDPYRHIKIGPQPAVGIKMVRFNPASLAFLLEHDFELIDSVFRAGRAFDSTISTINRRSKLWQKELKPRLAIGESFPEGVTNIFCDKLPQQLIKELKQSTNSLIKFVDEDVALLDEVTNAFGQLAGRLYPELRVLKMETMPSPISPIEGLRGVLAAKRTPKPQDVESGR